MLIRSETSVRVNTLQEGGRGSQWVCRAPGRQIVLASGDVALLVAGLGGEGSTAFGKVELLITIIRIETTGMTNLKLVQCKMKLLVVSDAFSCSSLSLPGNI